MMKEKIFEESSVHKALEALMTDLSMSRIQGLMMILSQDMKELEDRILFLKEYLTL